jgi:hypothetical protein
MATYLPPDYQFNVDPFRVVRPAESRWGGGGHRGATADEDRARYLIVSVLNDPLGRQALSDLAEQARDLGLVWIGTLGDELRRAGIVNSRFADGLPHRFALLRIESGSEAQALREVFRFECRQTKKGKKEFLAVEPDYPLRYFVPMNIGANFDLRANGSSHDSYASMLNVDDAHNNGVDGDGVTVAVVDSGVEKSGIASEFEDLQVPANVTETDQNGHGTAMTGIIRAIAPDAKVIAIRISDGYPRMWKLMLGVSSASMEHTADIINISMGLDSIPTACAQCGASSPGLSSNLEYFLEDISHKELGSNGAPLLVASTGNDGSSSDLSCPAKWDSTVAVGAINSNRLRSRFSTHGASSHPAFLVMPGGDEDAQGNVSEWAGKGDGAECVGTSPAAAYASGILALYASDPNYQTSNRPTFLTNVLGKCDDKFTGYQVAEHGKGFLPYVKK